MSRFGGNEVIFIIHRVTRIGSPRSLSALGEQLWHGSKPPDLRLYYHNQARLFRHCALPSDNLEAAAKDAWSLHANVSIKDGALMLTLNANDER